MAYRECCVCKACGCGTALYEVGGKLYCAEDKPVIPPKRPDDQVLTLQQQINIRNGR